MEKYIAVASRRIASSLRICSGIGFGLGALGALSDFRSIDLRLEKLDVDVRREEAIEDVSKFMVDFSEYILVESVVVSLNCSCWL